MQSKDNFNKKAGILLSITSLPSNYGIGSLGKEAYNFVDLLRETKQDYWQILPLCPVGKGNSPYSSVSSFAGEILLIDIDSLMDINLLEKKDIPNEIFPKNVDYQAVRKFKIPLLKIAVNRFNKQNQSFIKFKEENEYWLKDYAIFMAIKETLHNISFYNWEEGLKYKYPQDIKEFEKAHRDIIDFYEITQYLFFMQYYNLKEYANKNNVKIIGDMPFYVSPESSDVWGNSNNFLLGKDMTPKKVAGVPPDIFSTDGQLWGNPIYDWEYQKENNYSWWKKRLNHNAKMYDAIRIDHFRAFADYYSIPYGAKTAKEGEWVEGVKMEFWEQVMPYINNTEIIAEDLGGDTDSVRELIEQTGFPNMKVLQFAFSSDLTNQFLPHNFNENSVCYTGTHDNNTVIGWYQTATKLEKIMFDSFCKEEEYSCISHKLISLGMKSKSKTVIIPLQDYLGLDSLHRLNTPGTEKGNWEWRYEKNQINQDIKNIIMKLTGIRK